MEVNITPYGGVTLSSGAREDHPLLIWSYYNAERESSIPTVEFKKKSI